MNIMQAGSFVTSTSSPPSTSTRNIALGAGSQVDRQWSLDVERSLISISGSFTQAQGLGVCQVSGKPPGGSPWTQVAAGPPRSPRQRTLSPMRMANGQAARVLSREVVDDRYMEAERLLQKSREVPRAPFLGMTSSQLSRQDDDLHIDGGLDRFRGRVSPAAVLSASHRVQPRQSLLTTAAAKSPRQRPLSPRGLRPGPDRTPPVAQRVHPGDADDHSSRSGMVFSADLNLATSRYVNTSHIESSIEVPQGALANRRSRLSRAPSGSVRARTLSPSRRLASSPMVVESKDSEESSVVIPSGLAAIVVPTGDRMPRMQARSFSPCHAAADIGESVGVHRLSVVPAMRSTDDAEVARRRELSPAPWPAPAAFAREQKQAREECPARVLSKEEAQALSRGKSPSVDATSAPLPAPTVAAQSPTPPGQKDVEVLEPVDRGWVPSAEELKPWLEAAKEFNMNSDFEISAPEGCDFAALMHIMKKESAGKWTIQAMADKLLLNGILENLGLPHMPMIFANRSPHKLRERLEILVDKLIIATGKKQPYDIIVKPTHLSSAMGVLSFDKVHAPHREETLRQLEEHMRKYLEAHAHKQESLALQSLKPGFIGQPKYKSVVGFKAPLELKVCALWGKARTGVWWWGTRAAGPAQVPHRNVWLTRKPAVLGELSDDDTWEVLHNHPGGNVGWENAVKIFQKNMPAMAALTEQLAVALGTPFLRADFFVGSSKWGVRLNEVAYGCGLEYRKLLQEGATECVVDDKPAMVEILRQGMALCSTRLPAQQFLERLGVQGTEYADSAVNALKAPLTTWASTLALEIDEELPELAAEECLCKSVKELPLQPPQQSQLIEQTLLHPQQLEQVREIRHVIKPHPPQIPTLPMLTLQNLAVRQPGQAKVFSSAQCSVPATSLRLHAPASHKANRRTSACGITIPPPRAAPVLVRVPVAR
mmetsp:Transcript_25411/g.40743  ORF Transcript_25411/g.40743 Transcript_25411/m.40743 type:complete len:939 (-) Transcript_25411:137-2953(-)